MRSLLDAIYEERRALAGCFIILIGTALIAATVMHLIEAQVQPDKFGTIPDGMWWAIVTLGTIGYGDAVPVTPLGRIVATVTIFFGLIMVALPLGIIASAFANDVHRRDFVVTWGMVARVPLFAGLNAMQIAEIMQLLRAQRLEAGAIVARRGDPAHSMYFVAAGEVEIHMHGEHMRLGPGHFFGEVAVLRKAHRSATVTAVTGVSLLVLDARDVHMLMEREPMIAERIERTARERVGTDVVEPRGDMVAVEIAPDPEAKDRA
jgi:voltage-gated potassium channel